MKFKPAKPLMYKGTADEWNDLSNEDRKKILNRLTNNMKEGTATWVTARPLWCMNIPKLVWAGMTDDEREAAANRRKPKNSVGAPSPTPKTTEEAAHKQKNLVTLPLPWGLGAYSIFHVRSRYLPVE